MHDLKLQPPEAEHLPRPRLPDGDSAPSGLAFRRLPRGTLPSPRRPSDHPDLERGEDGTRPSRVVGVGVGGTALSQTLFTS